MTAVEVEMTKIEPNEPTTAHRALATLVRSISAGDDEGISDARELFAQADRSLDAHDCASYALVQDP